MRLRPDRLLTGFPHATGIPYLTELTTKLEGTGHLVALMQQMGQMKITGKVSSISTEAVPAEIFSVPEGDFKVPQSARRRGTTVEYTCSAAGRPGKYARHLLASGQVDVKPLLTHDVKIEELDKGLELLGSREAIKVTFDMGR